MAKVREQPTPAGNLSAFRVPLSKEGETERGSARVDEVLGKVGTGASVELFASSRELVDTTYASWWGANDLLGMALDDDGKIHVLSRDESNKIYVHTSETEKVHLTGSDNNPAEADYFAVGERLTISYKTIRWPSMTRSMELRVIYNTTVPPVPYH